MKYDKVDAAIIKMLQGDIPLEKSPFRGLAQNLNMTENEVLERVRDLQSKGIIRRWGAVLRHQKAGYSWNAMVVWRTDAEKADQCGEIMASFKEVSHCYLRDLPGVFNLALFTMIHAQNEQEMEHTIKNIAESTGLVEYTVLKSLREFKKVSMKYI